MRIGTRDSFTCIYCGHSFGPNDLRWYIYKKAIDDLNFEADSSGRTEVQTVRSPVTGKIETLATPLLDLLDDASQTDTPFDVFQHEQNPLSVVMEQFRFDDTTGRAFYTSMGGSLTEQQRRKPVFIVQPEDFIVQPGELSSSDRNRYRTPEGKEINIFRRPERGTGASAGGESRDNWRLCFTEEFIGAMSRQGFPHIRESFIRDYIESECIRPVCPHCTSFIPRGLLQDPENSYILKFAFIGPVGSGKTTFNLINILLNRFARGQWSMDGNGIKAITHYLSEESYYGKALSQGTFPDGTSPDEFMPPLLMRLRYGNGASSKRVFLALMDVAGEFLQDFSTHLSEDQRLPLRDFNFLDRLKEMDGYLLMLNAEQEILNLPFINRAPNKRGKKLEELLGFYEEILNSGAFQRKPAALIITKCDTLFRDDRAPLSEKEFYELFSDFTPLEQALWQTAETDEESLDAWQADRHEALQFCFQPLIERYLRSLWKPLRNSFSRVNVFPESSVGHLDQDMEDLKEKTIKEIDEEYHLEHFYSTDPIFWLMSLAKLEQSPENGGGKAYE